jgi:hypothetical protein
VEVEYSAVPLISQCTIASNQGIGLRCHMHCKPQLLENEVTLVQRQSIF